MPDYSDFPEFLNIHQMNNFFTKNDKTIHFLFIFVLKYNKL